MEIAADQKFCKHSQNFEFLIIENMIKFKKLIFDTFR